MKSACRPERHVVVDYTIWKGKKKQRGQTDVGRFVFLFWNARRLDPKKKTLRARVTVDSYIYIFFSLSFEIFFL